MCWILLLAALVLSLPMHAGDATALPPGGSQLVTALPVFRGSAERSSCAAVAVDGLPFAQALRISVHQPSQPWDIEAKVPVTAALAG